MHKYKMMSDENSVTIAAENINISLDGFIDFYLDDGYIKSPFKSHEEAILFAEIVLNLLELMDL